MQNMKSIMDNHNIKVLSNTSEIKETVTAKTRTTAP